MDVINRGMLFAGVLLLCAFPFLIVLNALAGRSVVDGFSRRLGLNQVAATGVSHLFTSSTTTTGVITGVTMRILLGSRAGSREVFPAAVATALFWLGMEIVFAFTFSRMVSSEYREYGAIDVVFALMSWLIATGVVVILDAVVGVVWREHHSSLAAPTRRFLGGRYASTGDRGSTGAARYSRGAARGPDIDRSEYLRLPSQPRVGGCPGCPRRPERSGPRLVYAAHGAPS